MLINVRIPQSAFDLLRQRVFAQAPREAGCFALAGISALTDSTAVLVRRAVPVPEEDFVIQEQYRLEVSSRATAGLISLCQANKLLPVVCHSHPGEIPYSPTDDYGEHRLARTFADFIPGQVVLVSLLFCPKSIHGRVWLRGDPEPKNLARIDVVGPVLRRELDRRPPEAVEDSEVVERQVLAFGKKGQRLVASTKVGIVGLGATGSATAEQLARLGISDFVVADFDKLSKSNVSRVYGSYAADVGDAKPRPPKVELAARNIRRINSNARVGCIQMGVHEQGATQALLDRDVLFMCTDEHRGRAVLNDLCYRYLIPGINMGVAIKSKEGRISAAVGGVDLILPDGPCLWCSQFLSAKRIRAESMPAGEREKLAREGDSYVENLDEPAPMVVSATSIVASLAVTEFLRLVTGFGSPEQAPQRLRWNLLEGTVSRGTCGIVQGCLCRKLLGRGDL